MVTEQIEPMMIEKGCERSSPSAAVASTSRKEKRKVAKKEKRKQKRKEVAEKERQEQEALLNDPEEQRRIQLEEEKEKERLERERREFEERERLFLEDLARRKAREEEEEREEEERKKRAILEEEQKDKEQQVADDVEANEDEEWEYVEEGPPEIIWQGNEIIVKKNKVRVKKKKTNQALDENRPISNPLPPQSEAFSDYKNVSTMLSAQQLLENVAQQTPNFGTEQDKAHCPFHLKTGACRFGARCNRVHFYPDKSCTLLIKNMYNGPGLAWEQDEGLETIAEDPCKWEVPGSGFAWVGVQRISCILNNSPHTPQELPPMRVYCQLLNARECLRYKKIFMMLTYSEEEVELSFEEFYDDVHTEFLKFGELVNFKVCRNGSHHLRGNAYVHYKSLESAMLAYHSINGRYFAGKQVSCEFVAVTRWKVAICGEYMKSKLKVCSRGSACNFIHCFRNPGGDYEWADWDKPPPRYWIEKMTALFGYSDKVEDDERIWDPIRRLSGDNERYRSQREIKNSNRSSRDPYDEDNIQRTKIRRINIDRRRVDGLDRRESREETYSRHHLQPSKKKSYDSESDTDLFNRDRDTDILWSRTRKHLRYTRKQSYDSQETQSSGSRDDPVLGTSSSKRRKERHGEEHREKRSGQKAGVVDNLEHKKRSSDSTNSSKHKTYEDRDLASIDDLWPKRSCDFDSTSELSDGVTERSHEYRSRSSTESHKISYGNRESEKVNSEKEFIQKRNSSSRKGVEAVSIYEYKRSDEEHVNRNSSQSDWKSESYDSDYSCGSVKTGSRKSKKDPPKKPKRKSSSDEKFVYDRTYKENHRDDTEINLDEDIDQRGRWESEHVDSEKEHKRRRKSHGKDDKHRNGSRSRYRSSHDERRSRSSSSSKSSHRKHRNSSKEMN